jgi:hypothetical protein
MSFFKKRPSVSEDAAGGGDFSMFGVTLGQLTELMELRGKQFVEKLNSSIYSSGQNYKNKHFYLCFSFFSLSFSLLELIYLSACMHSGILYPNIDSEFFQHASFS